MESLQRFQSAPRAHARGDPVPRANLMHWRSFNPRRVLTHAATARCARRSRCALSFNPRRVLTHAATGPVLERAGGYEVSIRAACSRTRRHFKPGEHLHYFNVSIRAACSRTRRQIKVSKQGGVQLVSIRAACSRTRRRSLQPIWGFRYRVSIRAACSRTRRRGLFQLKVIANQFQSAPRAHARGDTSPRRLREPQTSFNPRRVLTHAATLRPVRTHRRI